MKYKFLITDVSEGGMIGTNDETLARDYAQSEDFFVADVERGIMFTSDGEEVEIAAAHDYREEGEEG